MRLCGMCGTELTRDVSARERRRVTSVFIDMAGFSTLTRDLDPEEMRDLADEVLTVVAGVIESYDGYVDSLRGDGLIALFGAPHSHPDDPQRAVLAAAASLTAIEEGGAVARASRLGEAAGPGAVWGGPEPYAATRYRLLSESTGPIELRGFPNVTSVHRLVRAPLRRHSDPYGHLPFVGRDQELATLE